MVEYKGCGKTFGKAPTKVEGRTPGLRTAREDGLRYCRSGAPNLLNKFG